MKKEITYNELQKLDTLITMYFVKNGYFTLPKSNEDPGGWTTKEPTKLVTNMKNIAKQAKKHFETYMEEKDNLQLDNCAVDEKTKVILKGEKDERLFTVEGEKKLKLSLKELGESKIELHTRITEGEWELNDDEIESFSGILIKEGGNTSE